MNDGTEGRVTETNWRSTNLLTAANNIVVLPNSILARQGVTNLSRPDEIHLITLSIRIAIDQRPRLIEDVMRSVLQASTLIVTDPPPAVALKAIDAIAIEVELLFRVASLANGAAAKNEIIDLIYDQCRLSGISLAVPADSLVFDSVATGERSAERGPRPSSSL